MKYIPVIVDIVEFDGEKMTVNNPVEPLPVDSIRNVFDAANNRYICYEPGDKLPD